MRLLFMMISTMLLACFSQADTLVITADRVVDVDNGNVIKHGMVVIENDTIISVSKQNALSRQCCCDGIRRLHPNAWNDGYARSPHV